MGVKSRLLPAVLVAAVAPVAGAAAVSLDGFTKGSLNLTATSASNNVGTNESGVDSVSGHRAVFVQHAEDDGGSTTLTLSPGGPLTLTGTNNLFGVGYGWDYSGGAGFGGDASTALHLDLSGTDAITLDFSADNTFTDVGILFEDSTGGSLSNENPGDNPFIVTSPGPLTISYSQLDDRGMNLADASFIEFTFQTFTDGTLSLAGVTADPVPEPAIASLAMAAFLLGAGSRRRRAVRA